MAKRRQAFLLVLLFSMVAAACGNIGPIDPSYGAGVLTKAPDEPGRYSITIADGVTTAKASADVEATMRIAFWLGAGAETLDQESCATFVDNETQSQQQGVVLRASQTSEGTRALTVTKNVFGNKWQFNVHEMGRGVDGGVHFLGGLNIEPLHRPDLPPAFVEPYPWRMCGRVEGNTISFKVWAPNVHDEPDWDDPAFGGSTTAPAGWDVPGRPGWYIGHLGAGESVGFTDLTTDEL